MKALTLNRKTNHRHAEIIDVIVQVADVNHCTATQAMADLVRHSPQYQEVLAQMKSNGSKARSKVR